MNSQAESEDHNTEVNVTTAARDTLLLKCRDAIESLHLEIEEERAEKQRLSEDLHELQRYYSDLQAVEQEKAYRIQKLTEGGIQM
jgi:FtsZ-binding cell division protein ZapB